ncbi:hypothetical protein PISL3812_04487 [Talaromyces islandicus]|uniref:Uncharacterized protein n=1 Tax=Talaromyces islandicus TaxID=28573 RepID=A0A0U1LVR4_TALIS|nr:hypothetical protein PISL3812_04487 [Talaromyces islandicus]
MSGSTTPGAKPAKGMSSRLLTMKFMQRSAAAAAQAAVDDDPQTPSPKRPRLSAPNSPANNADLQAVNAALAAEERKRAEAVARQAAEAGESEWVLDFHGSSGFPGAAQPVIVAADSLDGEFEDSGRMSFGNFKPKKKSYNVMQQDEDEDSTDPAQAARKKAERKKKHGSQDADLRHLTSISGGGRISGGGGGGGDGKKHGNKPGKKRSK